MILPSTDQRNEEFLRLLGQHEAGLLGYILSLVPNWADDDIAEEVRIRLWKQFDSYDRSKDFGTWACTIAHYMVHAHRERLSRYGRLFSSPLADLIAREVAAIAEELSASQQTLKDCFEKLPEGKRELLTTYYSGVHTGREIAAQLGQSYDATRQARSVPGWRCGIASMKRCGGGPLMTDTPPRDSAAKRQEIYDLALALLDCTITAKEAERLAGLVSDDREARRHYVRFMYDAAKIRRWSIAAAVVRRARPTDRLSSPVPPINAMERFAAFRLPVLQPFLGSVLLSYLLAVSILGAGVLAAWMWRSLLSGRGDSAGLLSSPEQVAQQSPQPAAPGSKPEVVAKITRMRGLKFGAWKHPDEAPADPSDVLAGCLYQMGPGAIEIVYNCARRSRRRGPCQLPCRVGQQRCAAVGQSQGDCQPGACAPRASCFALPAVRDPHAQRHPGGARRRGQGPQRRLGRVPNRRRSRPRYF